MTPEGYVKARLDIVLKNTPMIWFFKPVQSGYGKRALDYICCIRGRFVAIETKRPKKDPTNFQRSTARDIYVAGGHVWFISDFNTIGTFAKWVDSLYAIPHDPA